jgi:thiol-disulfide isomerase/thioredoxin
MLAVFAAVFALGRVVLMLPVFGHGPYGAYAKGELARLSFKFAGQPAPVVAFIGPGGQPMSLAAFRGKAILVNLWATWCAPCVTEMPALDALQAALGGDKFQVVAINMDADQVEAAKEFLSDHTLAHLPLYADPKLLMDPALAAPGIPASVLYDPQGKEIARLYGAVDWASPEARALIERMIRPPAKS